MMRCELCQEWLGGEDRVNCECGWTLHRRCAEDHAPWCTATGRDRWIGVREFRGLDGGAHPDPDPAVDGRARSRR